MTVSAHNIAAYIGTTPLDIVSADIGLDESWSPYIQGSLTIPLPDAATLAGLDPRNKVHLRLFIEQVFGESKTIAHLTSLYSGGTIAAMTTAYTTKFLFQLTALWYTPWNSGQVIPSTRRDLYVSLRHRNINHASSTLTLDFSSEEGYLHDYALVANETYNPGSVSVRAVVTNTLNRLGLYLQAGTADAVIAGGASNWLPGQSAWDYLTPLVQQGKLRLYADEKGAFYLVSDSYVANGQTTLTYTGTIVDAADDIDRDADEWFDAVVIKYTWVDSTGLTNYAYDTATTTGYSKVKSLEYDTIYPGPGAARQVLNRTTAKGRIYSLTAISDYAVTPSQAVMVSLPDTDVQTGYVQSVRWSYPGDEMAVTTRGLVNTPPTAWVFTPAGVSWNSRSVGVSWNTYTYP